MSLAKIFSRLYKEGTIARLAKGKYYIPKQTAFGRLRPSEPALIDALTMKNGRRTGYLTGVAVYNRLGLTSQISNTLVIATNKPLPPKEVEGYKFKFVKRTFEIKEQDIPKFQLLDALQDIKNIPDSPTEDTITVLKEKINSLSTREKERLVQLALSYSAGTRALLGAITENSIPKVNTNRLLATLNNLTSYQLNVSESVLPNKSKWNIR